MTRGHQFVLVLVLVLVLVTAVVCTWCGQHADPHRVLQPELAGHGQTPTVEASPVPADPAVFTGLHTWSAQHQLDVLTSLQHQAAVSPSLLPYLLTLVQDRALTPVVRNAAASIATRHAFHPAALASVFMSMATDSQETPLWRDYALQHLTTLLIQDGSGQDLVDWLAATSANAGTQAATAVLQLQRLEDGGHHIDQSIFPLVFARALNAPERNVGLTVTVLGLIAQRHARSWLPRIRQLCSDGEPAVRRTALAVLGALGGSDDIGLLVDAEHDRDPSVMCIAATAKASLIRRLTRTAAETE